MTTHLAVGGACRARGHHRAASLRATLARDLDGYLDHIGRFGGGGLGRKKRLSAVLSLPMRVALLHRVAHFLYVRRRSCLARLVEGFNAWVHKVRISAPSCIDGGLVIPHPAAVTFHGTAGRDLRLYAMSVCGSGRSLVHGPLQASPHLGAGVRLGAHSVVLGALKIGDHARVAFATTVRGDVPASSLAISRRALMPPRTTRPGGGALAQPTSARENP